MVLIYLFSINLLAFVLMAVDKRRAICHRQRIPERVLLGTAFLGGSLGGLCGMFLMRHKTRHLRFRILLPLFFLLHCALFIVFYYAGE